MGQLEKAMDLFRRALETDDVVEEFYQRLMQGYEAMGEYGESGKICRRCKEVLIKKLGIEPSLKTEALFKSLQARQKTIPG
jgi:DNA-binding SARP family transcriptional activator